MSVDAWRKLFSDTDGDCKDDSHGHDGEVYDDDDDDDDDAWS